MKKNPFRPFVYTLSDKAIYDLMGAIRGYDKDRNTLMGMRKETGRVKSEIIMRLRAITFPGWSLRERMSAESFERSIPTSTTPSHFLCHVARAIKATAHHPIWGGYGKKLLEVWKPFLLLAVALFGMTGCFPIWLL